MVPLWYVSEISYLLKFLTVTQGNHGMVIATQISNLNLSSASPSPNFHSAERVLKKYLARYQ